MSSRSGGSPAMGSRSALLDLVRPGGPGEFLLTGAYHTPSGHLHLGHLGGPFLSADVLGRHLESLGHRVRRIGCTDAHEAYVLYAAELEGRPPGAVASAYASTARAALAGFDMHYDSFLDFSDFRWRQSYHDVCHRIAEGMLQGGRLTVASPSLPLGRSGRFVIGPFALGLCPACGAGAAGTSCEDCGMWFGPDELREVRPRFERDAIVAWKEVPTAYLQISGELTAEAVAARFPRGCGELLERFLARGGRRMHLSHPLGWGVPWKAQDLGREVVHVSYGTGSYAAAVVIGEEYRRLAGAEASPFHRDSEVTTILTGGVDAALPSMLLMAFADERSGFDPFRANVVNRFMLLDGEKFSTTRKHVILGSDYLEAGLSPDPFRLYAARISRLGEEADFTVSGFSRWALDFLAGRLDPLCATALGELAGAGEPPALQADEAERIAAALVEQAAFLVPPEVDLSRAAAVIEEWVGSGEGGMAAAAPYWWLKALCVLAYPFTPRWSGGLWRRLGEAGIPAVERLERGAPVRQWAYEGFDGLEAARLARLDRRGEGDDG